MLFSGSTLYDRSSELIESLNRILAESWSVRQISVGKKIEIPSAWGTDVIGFTASRYRKQGWLVTTIVEISSGTRIYFLSFKNPKWKKHSDQFS